MASNLKWRYGFSWFSVVMFIGFGIGAFYLTGTLKWVFAVLAVMTLSYLMYQYRKWNSTVWRKVHFRGMLLYSEITGREVATAQAEGREHNVKESCRQLGIAMCGAGSNMFVNAMVEELYNEEGNYCIRLLKKHHKKILPNLQQIFGILEAAEKISFGPQLIICNIIENTYGGEEAAKYVLALISGEAR